MNWFQNLLPTRIRTDSNKKKKSIPEGLWKNCPACKAVLYRADLERNLEVCPKCNHHMRIGARKRLNYFLDEGSQKEINNHIEPVDVLRFRDSKKYRDRLNAAQRNTGEKDALVTVTGEVKSLPVVVCAFEFGFMGGSMASVVGEKFVRAVDTSINNNSPLLCFSASGGARMQESLTSLMQMAKTSSALSRLRDKGIPFISILTDPTMGGVSASLAMLGDIHIAEPKALIGFAGPRVIEQTVRETLPEGFQRSEFLLEHGAIDQIIDRRELPEKLAKILAILTHQ